MIPRKHFYLASALLLTVSTPLLAATPSAAFKPLPLVAPAPADNPTTAAKVALGKQLFFDPRLSLDGTVSCNSCHNVTSNGTPNRPFDQYLRGDRSALSSDAVAGMKEVENLGCVRCHRGPALAGPADMPTGQAFYQWFPAFASRYDAEFKLKEDLGHNEGMTPRPHTGKWRVPTLRNIALTAPYFHNGSVPTLDQAVRVMAKAQLNREIDDRQAAVLVAFLKSLTGEFSVQTPPTLPDMDSVKPVGPISLN